MRPNSIVEFEQKLAKKFEFGQIWPLILFKKAFLSLKQSFKTQKRSNLV